MQGAIEIAIIAAMLLAGFDLYRPKYPKRARVDYRDGTILLEVGNDEEQKILPDERANVLDRLNSALLTAEEEEAKYSGLSIDISETAKTALARELEEELGRIYSEGTIEGNAIGVIIGTISPKDYLRGSNENTREARDALMRAAKNLGVMYSRDYARGYALEGLCHNPRTASSELGAERILGI